MAAQFGLKHVLADRHQLLATMRVYRGACAAVADKHDATNEAQKRVVLDRELADPKGWDCDRPVIAADLRVTDAPLVSCGPTEKC